MSAGAFKAPSTGIFGNDYAAELQEQGLSQAEIVDRVVARDIELARETGVIALDARSGEISLATPAAHGDSLYVRTQTKLYRIGGKRPWLTGDCVLRHQQQKTEGHMLVAVLSLVVGLAAAPADMKGKWDGKISGERPDGTTFEDSVLLVLDQKETAITGTVGESESDQHPITNGKIDGNKVTLLATHATNGREYRLELTVEGDELKGSVFSGDREVKLQARKRKK